MKRAMIAAALVLLLPAPATASTADATTCRNTYGGDVISAQNMRCGKARDIVRTWAVRFRRDGRDNRRVLGFRCRRKTLRFEGHQVTCRRARRSVRFYPNVPR